MEHLLLLFMTLCWVISGCAQKNTVLQEKPKLSEWQLVWSDDFDYPNTQLDAKWNSQNGPNTHILCGRRNILRSASIETVRHVDR